VAPQTRPSHPTVSQLSDPNTDEGALPIRAHRGFGRLPLSPTLVTALTGPLGLETPTALQAACTTPALDDIDLLAQTTPGSRDALPFLLPVVERLLRAPPWRPRDQFAAVILATDAQRVLEIYQTLKELVTFTDIKLGRAMTGGYSGSETLRLLEEIDIVVATPGRLLEYAYAKEELRPKLGGLKTVVIEDVHTLVSVGMWPDVEGLLLSMPAPRARQTLLFTSALTPEVLALASRITRAASTQVIKPPQAPEPFSLPPLRQEVIITSLRNQFGTLHHILREAAGDPRHKVLVYFPTTRLNQIAAEATQAVGSFDILAVHANRSPAEREAALEAFRTAPSAVLFSSDTPTHGHVLPNVTHVIIVGITASNEQYVLRTRPPFGTPATDPRMHVGRVTVLLAEFEAAYLDLMQPFDLMRVPPPTLSLTDETFQARALESLQQRDDRLSLSRSVYISFMNYYLPNERVHRQAPSKVVAIANTYVRWLFALNQNPKLDEQTAWLLGLLHVPGLILEERIRPEPFRMKPKRRCWEHLTKTKPIEEEW